MIYFAEQETLEHEADDEIRPGVRRIKLACANGEHAPVGYYQKTTGDIYESPDADTPIVRIVGALEGQTGQVTILQENGNYRRFSRWDRIDDAPPSRPDAIIRTLPQCGCGGALGMPKLFDSFEEMSVYFYATFFLGQRAE